MVCTVRREVDNQSLILKPSSPADIAIGSLGQEFLNVIFIYTDLSFHIKMKIKKLK